MKRVAILSLMIGLIAGAALGQGGDRPASPRGQAATQLGGKWVEVDYGRPILRGRTDIFGAGADFGKRVNAGAPVWRVGANQSTRLKTDVDLVIGGKTVPAGEYSLFVELKSPTEWQLIVSSWGAQQSFSRDDKENLWGSYGYTADKDVARATMVVTPLEVSVNQLTIGFLNCDGDGGELGVWWDKQAATVAFQVK